MDFLYAYTLRVKFLNVFLLPRSQLVQDVFAIVIKFAHGALAEIFTVKRQLGERRQLRDFVEVLKVLDFVGREEERVQMHQSVAEVFNSADFVCLQVELLQVKAFFEII